MFKSYRSYITLMICLLFRAKAAEYSGGDFFQLIEQNEVLVSGELSLERTDPKQCFHQCGLLSPCRYVLSDIQNGHCELVNNPEVDGSMLQTKS